MHTNYSKHALERCFNRIGLALGNETGLQLLAMAEECAKHCTTDAALRFKSPLFVGKAWTDTSNGDTVVAIVRDKRVVTYMFRRSTQPFTAVALRVTRCVDLTHLQG